MVPSLSVIATASDASSIAPTKPAFSISAPRSRADWAWGLLDQIRLLAHGHVCSHGQGQRQERDSGDGRLLERFMGGCDLVGKLINKPSQADPKGCLDLPAGEAAAGKTEHCLGVPKPHRRGGSIRIQEHGGGSTIQETG